MAESGVDAQRYDPYKNFKFRVKWDGRYVAGVRKVSGLKRTTEVITHREGGDPSTAHTSAGRRKSEAITLERGVTHDAAFEQWATRARKDLRTDVILELYNEAGQLVIAYRVFRTWVSEYRAVPDLDANANAVAIQTLRLENEGWARDHGVTEPTEPSFDAS